MIFPELREQVKSLQTNGSKAGDQLASQQYTHSGPTTGANASSNVRKPSHYNSHPSGIECIEIVKHMDFLTGSAIKYAWRSGLKTNNAKEDFEKAIYCLQQRVAMLHEKEKKNETTSGVSVSDAISMHGHDCEHRKARRI